MRKALDEYLSKKQNYHLLIADLGYFDKIENTGNLINTGVQESNLVNIACGLALSGVKVFIYSVSGFVIQRAYEQIKFNICQKSKNVTFITAGAGLCYNKCGTGHYLNNDFALMATLPDITMYAPVDKNEFVQILLKIKLLFRKKHFTISKSCGIMFEGKRVVQETVFLKDSYFRHTLSAMRMYDDN